jgi:hypothetical protein
MSAKDLVIKPIKSTIANAFVKKHHYSGKVVQNSTLHLGVFWFDSLEGVLSFGSSMDKRKIMGLVRDTGWNDFLELNRMAFSDRLPRNSESRAIAISMKLIKKYKPNIKWVISFADACQCGDGTIYRASGFVLTAIKANSQIYQLPRAENLDIDLCHKKGLTDKEIEIIKQWLASITPHNELTYCHKLTVEDRPPSKMSLQGAPHSHKMSLQGAPHSHKMSLEGGQRPSALLSQIKIIMRRLTNGKTSADTFFKAIGGIPSKGYQLRYIYFIDKSFRNKLTVKEIPFSKIKELGASMYKGKSV